MSKFPNWNDYLKARKAPTFDPAKGLVGKDDDGPLATKPKLMKPKAAKVYQAQDDDDQKNTVWTAYDDDEKKPPLAVQASPPLKPTSSSLGEKPPDARKSRKPKKMLTTEEFLAVTKDLSNLELLDFMAEEKNTQITTVTDLHGNQFTPDPEQSIQYVAGLLLGNRCMLERFLREIKRRDGLKEIIEEILSHPEAYQALVEAMEDQQQGEQRCQNLARSMNDRYFSFFDQVGLDNDDVDESVDAGPRWRWPKEEPPEEPDEDDTATEPPQTKPSLRYLGDSSHDRLLRQMAKFPHMKRKMGELGK